MAGITRRGFVKASGALAAAPVLATVTARAQPPAPDIGNLRAEKDIVFGKGGDIDLLLDVYRPPEGVTPKRLAIIHLFGGGFFAGNKNAGYIINDAKALGARGYTNVSANYRLQSQGLWPAQIHDVKAAIRWTRANAARIGVDADKIVVAGYSAGGMLSLLAAGTNGKPEFEGAGGTPGVSSDVNAAIGVYPLASAQIARGLFGEGGATPENIAAASPTTYIGASFAPTIFVHGTADTTVPLASSIDFFTKLQAAGVPTALTAIQGAAHAFDNAALDAVEVMAQSIDLFLDRLLISKRPYPSFGGGGRPGGGRPGGGPPGGGAPGAGPPRQCAAARFVEPVARSNGIPSPPRIVAAAVLCASLSFPAAAHHSFAAVFRMDTVTEIEGRVTAVHWINPHITIDVAGNDGQSWEVEAGPVNLLSRMGIEKAMLEVGTTIKVRGSPGRRNAQHLWVSNILLANGTELLAAPGARPYWGSNAVGDASVFFAAGDSALPAGAERSLFRIWSPLISAFPRPRGTPVLTAEGRRAQARYEGDEQAVADCEVPGMPYAMMSPYPIEIVRQGDRLLIRGEAYDLARTVHLTAPASAPAPSPLGLSVGRITADEIVIETSGIDYHSYGDLGPAQSNQSRVVERFKLSADGLTLDYEITVTDPVMLAEPWAWGGSFVYREGAELRAWNCGADRG